MSDFQAEDRRKGIKGSRQKGSRGRRGDTQTRRHGDVGKSLPPLKGPRGMCALAGRSGFTLVETMVAILILVIIIGAIYGTFRAGNASVARTEESVDVYQTARILLEQMRSELSSAYQPSGLEQSSMVGEDTDRSITGLQCDMISFLTTSHRLPENSEPRSDLCRVVYTVPTTPDGEPLGLYVREDLHPGLSISEDERPPILLSELVIGLDCEYLDGRTDEWQPDWVDRTELPKAVRIELALKPDRVGAKPITLAATANIRIDAGPGEEQANVEGDNAQ